MHTVKRFNKAIKMLSKIRLPEFEEDPLLEKEDSSNLFFSASVARNLTHLSRMKFSLSATYKFLCSLENDITKSVDLLMINQYFYILQMIPSITQQAEELHDLLASNINGNYDRNSVKDVWVILQHELSHLLIFLEDDWFALQENKNTAQKKLF